MNSQSEILMYYFSMKLQLPWVFKRMPLSVGIIILKIVSFPAGSYLLKVNNRNTETWGEICPKLTIKAPERHRWSCSGVFIVNFEHISHFFLVFLVLTLNM